MSRLIALDLRDAPQDMHDRFWSKVDVRSADECWPWLAYKLPNGYGRFMVYPGLMTTASRVGLALKIGSLPAGYLACHTCDNPPCVNPAHLFMGTNRDNGDDMLAKGRGNKSHGVDHFNAKLTPDAVRAIRSTPLRFGTKAQLAREFGVSTNVILAVIRGEAWKHVA